MRRSRTIIAAGMLSLVLTGMGACLSRGAEESGQRPSRPPRRSNVLITREELVQSSARDAFQAVQTLRPDWLRGRGATSITGGVPQVVVYVDGQRVGTRNVLAQFAVISIKELRYHSATDATQRWGTGHGGGVIEVITR